jgi:hypothetical protein
MHEGRSKLIVFIIVLKSGLSGGSIRDPADPKLKPGQIKETIKRKKNMM